MLKLIGLSDKISFDMLITLTEKDIKQKEEQFQHSRLGVRHKLHSLERRVYLIDSIKSFLFAQHIRIITDDIPVLQNTTRTQQMDVQCRQTSTKKELVDSKQPAELFLGTP